MLDLGLTKAEQVEFERALRSSHDIKLEVRVLDSNEDPIGNLSFPSTHVLAGQVDVDATADITRSLSMTLLDPTHRLKFTPDNAAQGAIYAENFLDVDYCVYVEGLGDWVDVPVFRGPVTNFSHDGAQVSVEAQGKEALGLDPHFLRLGFTLKKHLEVEEAIKHTMRKVGERKFDLPEFGNVRVGTDMVVEPGQEAWRIVTGGEDANGNRVQGLVELTREDRAAIYDARGRLTARRRNQPLAYVFRTGEAASIITPPVLAFDILEFRNFIKVIGAKGKGDKKSVSGVALLPDHHPLSPKKLARNGEPRYMAAFYSAPSLKTESDCADKAKDTLERKAKAGIDVQFEALPIPHLEEWDMVKAETEEGPLEFALKQFTLPLTSTESMSIGYNKRIKQYRRGSGKKREARAKRKRLRSRQRRRDRRKDRKDESKR